MKKISGLLAFIALVFTQLVFASATVTHVAGTASVQTGASASRALRLGDQVNQGDTVATGANSSVVIKFDDGQVAALTSNTRLTVSAYRYDASSRTGNVLLSLISGGMRAVTGLIGRNSPQNVSYRAATATIGIRGTDVTIATNGKDVVVSVSEGAITFSFQGKSVTIPAGQAGAILDGTLSQGDRAAIMKAVAGNGLLTAAIAQISTEALSLAVSMANTGPISGEPTSVQSGASTITHTPGAGAGAGGGSASPTRP